jgi:hypothetical protein
MAKPSIISVKIRDNDGYTASTDAYVVVDGANTIAATLAAIVTWLGLVQNATAGRVIGAALKLAVDVSSFATHAMTAGIPVSAGTALIFPNNVDTAPWDFVIPARAAATTVGGKPDVTTEGATLDLLADAMENGATSGTTGASYTPFGGLTGASFFTNNTGGDLYGPAGGRLITRKHRKLLQSRSSSAGI